MTDPGEEAGYKLLHCSQEMALVSGHAEWTTPLGTPGLAISRDVRRCLLCGATAAIELSEPIN